MDSAVYIGAGHDIIPVLVMKHIKNFIYIDSQPFSEHGTHVYLDNDSSYYATIETRIKNEEDNLLGRPKFKEQFEKLMKQNNFTLESTTKYCWIYKNTYDQVIKYHVSCSFPEFLTDEIKEDISNCNTLILCGYFPHKIIASMMPLFRYVICNTHTCYIDSCYEDDDDYNQSITKYLIDNPTIIKKYFLLKEYKKYEYWEHKNIIDSVSDNYKVIECDNLGSIVYYSL
jgi:hypothetical protein